MTALALCRFAHFMAAMLAFGAGAYLWLFAEDRLRRALEPVIGRLVAASSIIALLTALLWLALEAASMADDWDAAFDPDTLGAVLATAFGQIWVAHLVLAAALVVAAVLPPPGRWATTTVLSGLLLASLALVGHAAMQSGAEGILHRANHAVHILAAAGWLGGLVPFAMCVAAYADDRLRSEAIIAMRRFSFFGQFVVAALVVTGAVNIALTSGRAPFPPATLYRQLLDAKIVLVALMIALALVNRLLVTPRLARSSNAAAVLRGTSILEAALGTIAVALVSLFGLLDPA